MHTVYPATTFDSTITYPSALYPSPTYTTGTTQEQLDGQAFFTSNATLHLPNWSNGSGRPGLIACHGRNLTGYTSFKPDLDAPWGDYTRSLVDAGFVILAVDMGYNSWSNNLTMRILDQAYTYLIGITGGTKVGFIGSSMGTNAALQWHRRHPDEVAGSFLISPFVDLDLLRNTGGWTPPYSIAPGDPNAGITYPTPGNASDLASVNGAYKSSNDAQWTAFGIIQGHTPARYPEEWRNRNIVLAHAEMDEGVPYQGTKWFVEQVNDPKVRFRRVTAPSASHVPRTHLAGGATDAATIAAGGLPRSEIRDFFHEVM